MRTLKHRRIKITGPSSQSNQKIDTLLESKATKLYWWSGTRFRLYLWFL